MGGMPGELQKALNILLVMKKSRWSDALLSLKASQNTNSDISSIAAVT